MWKIWGVRLSLGLPRLSNNHLRVKASVQSLVPFESEVESPPPAIGTTATATETVVSAGLSTDNDFNSQILWALMSNAMNSVHSRLIFYCRLRNNCWYLKHWRITCFGPWGWQWGPASRELAKCWNDELCKWSSWDLNQSKIAMTVMASFHQWGGMWFLRMTNWNF